jgi:2-phospho-L-lactate guanylyltransferase
VTAAIFVKPLHLSKLRLSRIMSEDQREQLTLRMLLDVVKSVKRAGIRRPLLVTSEPRLKGLAGQLGLTYIDEQEPKGVNRAAEEAINYSRKKGYRATLLIPADIPFARPSDIKRCIAIFLGCRLPVVCPSRRYDGTNLLVVDPQSDFKFHYEEGGVWAHVRSALASSEGVCVVYSPSIALDLDTEEDLAYAVRKGSPCSTSRFLKSLKIMEINDPRGGTADRNSFTAENRLAPHSQALEDDGPNPRVGQTWGPQNAEGRGRSLNIIGFVAMAW